MAVSGLLSRIDEIPSLLSAILGATAGALVLGTFFLAIYNWYFHPLANYSGPWYATATSLSLATISWRKAEPRWLQGLVTKYGSECIWINYGKAIHMGTYSNGVFIFKPIPQFGLRLLCCCSPSPRL
jgi:hypothetical protein